MINISKLKKILSRKSEMLGCAKNENDIYVSDGAFVAKISESKEVELLRSLSILDFNNNINQKYQNEILLKYLNPSSLISAERTNFLYVFPKIYAKTTRDSANVYITESGGIFLYDMCYIELFDDSEIGYCDQLDKQGTLYFKNINGEVYGLVLPRRKGKFEEELLAVSKVLQNT